VVTTRPRRHSPQFFGILPASVDSVIDDRPIRAIDVEESLGMQHAVDAGRDQHASKRPITKLDIDNVTVIDGKFRPSQIVGAIRNLRDLAPRRGQDQVDRMAPTAEQSRSKVLCPLVQQTVTVRLSPRVDSKQAQRLGPAPCQGEGTASNPVFRSRY